MELAFERTCNDIIHGHVLMEIYFVHVIGTTKHQVHYKFLRTTLICEDNILNI